VTKDEQIYDIIVAGGGLSGCLAAARLAHAHPATRILLIEKEATLGGRLRSSQPELRLRGYGLSIC
jgi:flavin-dependent dehydrogenase